MRFNRLNAAGLPASTGTDQSTGAWAVTDAIKVDLQFQYDTGTDVVQKDGAGRLCFVRKRPDNLKNATVKFETCGGDPRMIELINNTAGLASVIGGATPTGFGLQNASCGSGVRNGIFVEWWTENYVCNAISSTAPNSRHFLPKVVANYDGGTWDEARHVYAFTGICNAGVVNSTAQVSTATGTVSGGPWNDLVGFAADTGYLYGYQTGSSEAASLAQATGMAGAYTALPAQ